MIEIFIHPEISKDLKICQKKKWYPGLGQELPRLYRLLAQDGILPGEKPVHHLDSSALQNKTFHAGINLPKENVGKRKGPRIIYIKESIHIVKIIYVGGHKDKRYTDPYRQVELIEERYQIPDDNYTTYEEI